MFIALVLVPVVALTDVGGIDGAYNYAEKLDPSLFDPLKGTTVLGIIGFLAWGLGYFGQPHIIVRFMAIRSVKDLKSARRIGIGWMFVSILGAMMTGLVGIAYFEGQGNGLGDPETVFIRFSDVLFHPYITGFLMAAILAAIMSTISSQLLVTSSALTEDFYKTFLKKDATDKQLVLTGRIAVLVVAIIWVQLGLSTTLYEMVPGFFTSLIFTVVVSLMTKQPVSAVQETFEEMEDELKDAVQ